MSPPVVVTGLFGTELSQEKRGSLQSAACGWCPHLSKQIKCDLNQTISLQQTKTRISQNLVCKGGWGVGGGQS